MFGASRKPPYFEYFKLLMHRHLKNLSPTATTYFCLELYKYCLIYLLKSLIRPPTMLHLPYLMTQNNVNQICFKVLKYEIMQEILKPFEMSRCVAITLSYIKTFTMNELL